MDTGQGKFEQIKPQNEQQLKEMMTLLEEKHPDHGGWFREGEVVELKGSQFRVKRIKPTEIVLKLLTRKQTSDSVDEHPLDLPEPSETAILK